MNGVRTDSECRTPNGPHLHGMCIMLDVLGNESATESATNDSGQTSKSIRSEGSRQMADVVKRMAKNSVGRKSELNTHSF